ncbi:MAG: UDP-N-acetylmuramate dehydrogenase [Alphaproteobacteria bacterium]|nr:UDP-N-acetylmuramate dehydrogenase [Alphaproteobacteria bacterium]
MTFDIQHQYSFLNGLQGKISFNAILADITWFQVGGAAQLMFRPQNSDDLQKFLRQKPDEVPLTVIGVGSNLLVRDGGVDGVVVRLGREFNKITKLSATHMYVGGAVLDSNISRMALEYGIGGLEFLSGIPGTVGGGVYMNAGCYGREFSDIVESVDIIGPGGQIKTLPTKEIGFSYRHSNIPRNSVVIGAILKGIVSDSVHIQSAIQDIQQKRLLTQPIRTKTGGSTFANPDPQLSNGKKAWQLIDEAGCRGLRRGDAIVSPMHCNFLINEGNAKAADLEDLGEEVRERVLRQSGINLRWEIQRIGKRLI